MAIPTASTVTATARAARPRDVWPLAARRFAWTRTSAARDAVDFGLVPPRECATRPRVPGSGSPDNRTRVPLSSSSGRRTLSAMPRRTAVVVIALGLGLGATPAARAAQPAHEVDPRIVDGTAQRELQAARERWQAAMVRDYRFRLTTAASALLR